MPADGSIIIDTRVNNKGAEADLKALQAKAKSTAQQIAALDKQLNTATGKRTKLADDLDKAKAAAQDTAAALEEVNAKLDAARAKNAAQVRAEFPSMSEKNVSSIAESRTLGQSAAEISQSEKLAAEYDKQEAAIASLSEKYDQQQAEVQRLTQQKQKLVAQLWQERQAVDQATAAYDREQKKQGASAVQQLTTAEKAMKRFNSRMLEIVSGALLFNIISSGLSGLVRWMGSALQSTDAFSSALRNLQGAASVAAAPLVNALGNALSYVINLLATGMSYLARFISMLTGKSLSAMKSSAKAMNSYGAAAGSAAKQTDKATRSLAGFDEITRLDAPQEDASGGGGGGGAAGPNYDFVDQTGQGFSDMLSAMQRFWQAFTALLAPSIAAWSAAWEQIKATGLAVWPQIQMAALGLWNNALLPLLNYLAGTFVPGVVNSFSQAFAPIVGGVASTAIQAFADFFVWSCGLVTDAVNNLVIPALDTVLLIWQGLMAGIQAAWAQYGQPLMDGVLEALRNIEGIFSNLYYTVIEPILQHLIQLVQQLWAEHLQQLWNDVTAMLGALGVAVLDLWNNVLLPLINWLISTFGPLFADVFNAAADLVGAAVGLIADALDIAMVALRGLLDFLSAVFRGDWDAAWEAIANTVTTIWDRIQSTIKGAVNGIIRFVNGMIQAVVNALNSLSFTVPDWVPEIGGSTFGFNLTAPQIPYLAQGAVIPPNREFLAVLGDQSSGTNIEAPLSTIEQAVANVLENQLAGQMAGFEAVVAELREVRQAIYDTELTEAGVGRAAQRWQRRQAIMQGV